MAETPSKRQREETQTEEVEETKRYKSYNHILSLLEEEEDEPSQDLSSLITTLQQELSSDSIFDPSQATNDPQNNPATAFSTAVDDCTTATSSSSTPSKEDEEDDRERVIRHLLEASDDELGIPNMDVGVGNVEYGDEVGLNGGDGGFAMCDGFWELEDEAANYYTLLQSELFM